MINEKELIFTNISKSLIGYNCKEVDSRFRVVKTEYSTLYEEYKKEYEKNQMINEALIEKNIEVYELKKEIDELNRKLSSINFANQKQHIEKPIIEETPITQKGIKKITNTDTYKVIETNKNDLLVGEIESAPKKMRLRLSDGESEESGFTFI